jgi:hypothetical protein
MICILTSGHVKPYYTSPENTIVGRRGLEDCRKHGVLEQETEIEVYLLKSHAYGEVIMCHHSRDTEEEQISSVDEANSFK